MLINILYFLLFLGFIFYCIIVIRLIGWLKKMGKLVYNKIRSY